MYKVFINDRAIVLTDKYEDYRSSYDTLFIEYLSKTALIECVTLLKESSILKELCVHTKDLEKLWTDFKENYKLIKAAGGVVTKNNKVLMILKNGHWDLPKGKMDGEETAEIAAKREVSEECGLNSLEIKKELDTTYYLFQDNGNLVLKKTKWFEMSSDSDGPLKGDAKEGITEVKWVDAGEWEALKKNSYPSVANILSSFF